MKRNQIVDPDTGRVDLRFNPMSIEEDYFIPVRGGQSSRIETLPGGSYTGDIEDVKYLRDKMFAAVKIPQSYISRGEGAEEDKSTLAQKDIRFARTVQRMQRSVITELEKVGTIHLYILGFKGKDLINFKLLLNNPSKISEMQELEHWRTKFDVASSATEGFFDKQWVAKNIFNLSEEEFVRIQRAMYHDAKFEAILGRVAEGIENTSMPGMPGPAGSLEQGDMGMEGMEGMEDMGGEEGDLGEEPAGEEPEEMGADALLATPGGEAPGKRDDEWYRAMGRPSAKKKPGWYEPKRGYLTPRSKGKRYVPVTDDRRPMGARKRNMFSQYSSETSKPTRRNIFPGLAGTTYRGLDDLRSLARGIYENLEVSSNYDEDEEKLFETKKEISDLIIQMEPDKDET
jgi:hypothetical protein